MQFLNRLIKRVFAFYFCFVSLDEILGSVLERTFADQPCKPMWWALNGTTAAPAPQRNPRRWNIGINFSWRPGFKTAFSNRTLSLLRRSELNYRKLRKKKKNVNSATWAEPEQTITPTSFFHHSVCLIPLFFVDRHLTVFFHVSSFITMSIGCL